MNKSIIITFLALAHFFYLENLNAQLTPGENFDLSAWKLQTLEESDSSFAQIYPISTHSSSFFYTNSADSAMVFRVPSNGGTTSVNASYPRVELRQMTDGANWPLSDLTEHVLTAQCRVMEISEVKPKTIIGQIHGHESNSELLKIRWTGLEPGSCFVEARFQTNDNDGSEFGVVLASGLSLGDTINYRATMKQGVINVTINGNSASQTYTSEFYGTTDDYYFKAGTYIQWNEDIVGPTVVDGETLFYKLLIENNINTSLNEGPNSDKIFIYPNPALDYVVLNLELMTTSNTSVEIIDSKGNLFNRSNLSPIQIMNNNSYRLNLNNLNAGIYWFRIESDQLIEYKKLIITK